MVCATDEEAGLLKVKAIHNDDSAWMMCAGRTFEAELVTSLVSNAR